MLETFKNWIRTYIFGATDLETSGVRTRTFFVPGIGGLGGSSSFGRLMPYYEGFRNIDIVDVGPFSSNKDRAKRLYKHIRNVYPTWSATNRINLVGHSMGCNTILEMLSLPSVDPRSINGMVYISPPCLGFANTNQIGRGQRLRPLFRLFILVLTTYEYLVPEWVRSNILFHTMLPPEICWYSGQVDTSIVPDVDELACADLYRRQLPYVVEHKIPLKLITTAVTVKAPDGTYIIPAKYGLQLTSRLAGLFLGVGMKTDRQVGRSFMSEDVSAYTLVSGHHDGVLHLQSQLLPSHKFENITTDATHLSTVSLLPSRLKFNSAATRSTTALIVHFLIQFEHVVGTG
jgi:pimeloyl-ACP methyl ester carboxylesterase